MGTPSSDRRPRPREEAHRPIGDRRQARARRVQVIRWELDAHDTLRDLTPPRIAANGLPSRRRTPAGGWAILAAAGLLARGSKNAPGLPSLPVASVRRVLAAHSCGGSQGFRRSACRRTGRSLFPLASHGGNRRSPEHIRSPPGRQRPGGIDRALPAYLTGARRAGRAAEGKLRRRGSWGGGEAGVEREGFEPSVFSLFSICYRW